MTTSSGPQDGAGRPAGEPDQPAPYRPGPSSGYYPQYPQNPYGPGREGGPPPQLAGAPHGDPAGHGGSGGYQGPTYPYGGPFPTGSGQVGAVGNDARRRPRAVGLALALLLVPAVLFLVMGLVLALVPVTPEMIPPEAGLDEAIAQTGVTVEQVLSMLRVFGAVIAVLAVLYAVLAVVSYRGKLGALIALTLLTVLFDLLWVFTLLSSGANPAGAILPVIVLGTSIAGVWLMFSAPARAWFAALRR